LTGTFSPTTGILANGNLVNINSSFSTPLTDVTGGPLQDGDLAVINAMTTVQAVPEPSAALLLLLGMALCVLACQLRRCIYEPRAGIEPASPGHEHGAGSAANGIPAHAHLETTGTLPFLSFRRASVFAGSALGGRAHCHPRRADSKLAKPHSTNQ
jgi:hypothetical protein